LKSNEAAEVEERMTRSEPTPVRVIDGYMRKIEDEYVIHYDLIFSDGSTRSLTDAEVRRTCPRLGVDYLAAFLTQDSPFILQRYKQPPVIRRDTSRK
jgi:hypothetical protein